MSLQKLSAFSARINVQLYCVHWNCFVGFFLFVFFKILIKNFCFVWLNQLIWKHWSSINTSIVRNSSTQNRMTFFPFFYSCPSNLVNCNFFLLLVIKGEQYRIKSDCIFCSCNIKTMLSYSKLCASVQVSSPSCYFVYRYNSSIWLAAEKKKKIPCTSPSIFGETYSFRDQLKNIQGMSKITESQYQTLAYLSVLFHVYETTDHYELPIPSKTSSNKCTVIRSYPRAEKNGKLRQLGGLFRADNQRQNRMF